MSRVLFAWSRPAPSSLAEDGLGRGPGKSIGTAKHQPMPFFSYPASVGSQCAAKIPRIFGQATVFLTKLVASQPLPSARAAGQATGRRGMPFLPLSRHASGCHSSVANPAKRSSGLVTLPTGLWAERAQLHGGATGIPRKATCAAPRARTHALRLLREVLGCRATVRP